ncbi:MAG TPA: hypothetical protein ENK57_08470 [Polyangiaceae bacterium]|nr:hypothetical protein [Polyangiaceae bacterium]
MDRAAAARRDLLAALRERAQPPAPASPEGEPPVVAEVEPASPMSAPEELPGETMAVESGAGAFPVEHERAPRCSTTTPRGAIRWRR